MTDEEISKIKDQVDGIDGIDGIEGMKVNERLFMTDLIDLFDKAKKTDKELAKRMLLALKVVNASIDKILN